MYSLGEKEGIKVKMDTILSGKKGQYCYIGNKIHRKYFDELIKRNKPVTIDEVIGLFKEAVDYGVEFDEYINNMINFETALLRAEREEPEIDPEFENAVLPIHDDPFEITYF